MLNEAMKASLLRCTYTINSSTFRQIRLTWRLVFSFRFTFPINFVKNIVRFTETHESPLSAYQPSANISGAYKSQRSVNDTWFNHNAKNTRQSVKICTLIVDRTNLQKKNRWKLIKTEKQSRRPGKYFLEKRKEIAPSDNNDTILPRNSYGNPKASGPFLYGRSDDRENHYAGNCNTTKGKRLPSPAPPLFLWTPRAHIPSFVRHL